MGASLPAADILRASSNRPGGPGRDLFADTSTEAGTSVNTIPNDQVRWAVKQIAREKPRIDKWREAAMQARRFFDGKQLSKEDQAALASAQRPDNAFNTLQKFIRFISGVERSSYEALVYNALDWSDEPHSIEAELITKTFEWIMAHNNGAWNRSRAFEDSLVTGMGWCGSFLDRSIEPRGMIGYPRFNPLMMLWPDNEEINLGVGSPNSVRWLGYEKFVDKDEALARWPDDEVLIQGAVGEDKRDQRPDTDFTKYIIRDVLAEPVKQNPTFSQQAGRVHVTEFQWFQEKPGYLFFDPLEKREDWMETAAYNEYNRRLTTIGEPIADFDRQLRRVYQKMFLLNQRDLLGGKPKKLPGMRFTFNPLCCHFDEEDRQFYGIMRIFIDPQKYANKFWNQLLEIQGVQAKGGLELESDAVATPKDLQEIKDTYGKPGSINVFAPGALSGQKVRQKQLPQPNASTMTILQYCTASMQDVSGISPEAFGGGAQNAPGVTMRQRLKAGLLILAGEFDALTQFRREEGYLILDFMKYIADDRIIRIGGPFDGQAVKLMRDPFTKEYDISIDETDNDPNLQENAERWVMQMGQTLIRMNKFLPEFIDAFRIPARWKRALKDAMQKDVEEKQKMMQMGMPMGGGRGNQPTMQERQAKTEQVRADAFAKMAKGASLLSGTKRDDLRVILESLIESTKTSIEADKARQQMVVNPMGGG